MHLSFGSPFLPDLAHPTELVSPSSSEPTNLSPISHSIFHNTHPMVTRSKNGIPKPKVFLTTHLSVFSPSTYKQVVTKNWVQAMQVEYDALQKHNTWTLVPPLSNHNIIRCK